MDCFRIENASTWTGDPGRNLPPCFYRLTGEIRGQIGPIFDSTVWVSSKRFYFSSEKLHFMDLSHRRIAQMWSLMSLPAISQVNYLDPRGFPTYTPSEVCLLDPMSRPTILC